MRVPRSERYRKVVELKDVREFKESQVKEPGYIWGYTYVLNCTHEEKRFGKRDPTPEVNFENDQVNCWTCERSYLEKKGIS